jgi:predicted amidohydrolase
MRVAVSQFATTSTIEENLATCLRMINDAAQCKPDLMVLPELCNAHSWSVDHNQAWETALTIDGDFLQAIAAQAKSHQCYISLGVSLRRDQSREHQNGVVKSNISISSCLFSPLGELLLLVDKQILLGHEYDYFISATDVTDKGLSVNQGGADKIPALGVVKTLHGYLGLLAGSDSLGFELARELTVNGAQLLCQPLNSFALDHSALHSAARASDNKIFIATSNKVGTLLPDEYYDTFTEKYYIASKFLVGAGESQIIAPNGQVLAKMGKHESGFIFADIDLEQTCSKLRPDGTDLSKQRRVALYQKYQQLNDADMNNVEHSDNVPVTANVALFTTYKNNEEAVDDVCHYIDNNLSDIIQLPELFFLDDKTVTHNEEQLLQIALFSESLVNKISSVLRPFQYVCTSLVIDKKHQAVLISEHGLIAKQAQLHFCKRYQWTELGNEVNFISLPLEQGNIKVAMLTGDDANIAEIVKVTACKGVHLLLVPFDIQEAHEVHYGLLSRAAENRICIVAASREKSFSFDDNNSDAVKGNGKNKNKNKQQKSTGLVANLAMDFTLFTQWNARKFDGMINSPLVKYQYGKITKALVHPVAAHNKRLTNNFDLLRDRLVVSNESK